MSELLMSYQEVKLIYRERLAEAEHHRLIRQVKANRPRWPNRLGSHIGELVVALALALRLR